MEQQTHYEATLQFVQQATWLTDDDNPAVVMLLAIAKKLDEDLNAPLATQWGLTYRNLLKRKPGETAQLDPLGEALLRREMH